jgi:hypothetical protein
MHVILDNKKWAAHCSICPNIQGKSNPTKHGVYIDVKVPCSQYKGCIDNFKDYVDRKRKKNKIRCKTSDKDNDWKMDVGIGLYKDYRTKMDRKDIEELIERMDEPLFRKVRPRKKMVKRK